MLTIRNHHHHHHLLLCLVLRTSLKYAGKGIMESQRIELLLFRKYTKPSSPGHGLWHGDTYLEGMPVTREVAGISRVGGSDGERGQIHTQRTLCRWKIL